MKMNTKTTLTRGLANYTDEKGDFHKCFAVSNGDIFTFWFGGIYISTPYVKATFESSKSLDIEHFYKVEPKSKEIFELLEQQFEFCVHLSKIDHPHESVRFNESNHEEEMFQDINFLMGAIEETIEDIMEEHLDELQMKNEIDSYKGLHQVTGAILLNMGFNKPCLCSAEVQAFHDFDGGMSQLHEDRFGNIHIFSRLGNDVFSYEKPLAQWIKESSIWLLSQQEKHMKKAEVFQRVIQGLVLNS